MADLTAKQLLFVSAYCGEARFNGTEAARLAKYKGNSVTLASVAYENLRKPLIKAAIRHVLDERMMTDEEAAIIIAEQARASISDFTSIGLDGRLVVDLAKVSAHEKAYAIKKIKEKRKVILGDDDTEIRVVEIETEIELYNAQEAAHKIRQAFGAYQKPQLNYNIDLTSATDAQLERIINGEPPDVVMATPGNGVARKEKAK